MSRPIVSGPRVARLACAIAIAIGGCVVLVAPSAHAAPLAANCSDLQTQLNAAVTGDVVTLAGICGGSYTLPADAITLEGAPGTTSGFDGSGATGPLLSGTISDSATLTLSSLTFEGALLTGSTIDGGGLSLVITGPGGVSLSGDTFIDNTLTGSLIGGAGLILADRYNPSGPASAPGPITITNSTFTDNTLTATSGGDARGAGAYVVIDQDQNAADLRSLTLSGNTFTANAARVSGSPSGDANVGGGLAVYADGAGVFPLTQSHDSFVGNAVTDSAPTPVADYGGGGEWAQGFNVSSTADVFAGNQLSGTMGVGDWSWGGGLGILNSGCQTLHDAGYQTASTALELVAAGNAIAGGTPDLSGGAGIYVGCDSVQPGNNLTLEDSTITDDSATAGGVAGIDGGSSDHLTLANTIDSGAVVGSDLGGFGLSGGGGTLTASNSDVCVAGAAPTGSSNICLPPALAGGTDVHETAASPTIEAGSNALVPSGLGTDVFGNPRIDRGGSATVDIGAAEFVHPGPLAVTGTATSVTSTGAQLSGSLEPQGTPTSYLFEYGTSLAYGSATAAVAGGAGGSAPATAALAGLQPNTTYDFRLVAMSAVGTSFGANASFTTAMVTPVISALTQTHRRWRVGPLARAARHHQAAVGTAFFFTLNVPATLTFTFRRNLPSRRVDGRCVPRRARNARRPKCSRARTAGIFRAAAAAGSSSHSFDGILGGHRFAAGFYTLRVVATDRADNTSPPASVSFTIVKP